MQIIKSFFKLLFFICPALATAQSTYLKPGFQRHSFCRKAGN